MRIAILVAYCLVVCSHAIAHEWTDRSGNYSVEAEFNSLRAADRTVVLKRQDGKLISVALDRLSDADQELVADLAATSQKSEQVAANALPLPEPPSVDGAETPKFHLSAARLLANAALKANVQETLPAPGAMPLAPDASGQSRRQTYSFRWVYYGHRSQFHLCPDPTGVNVGTGLYWWPPHCPNIHLLDHLTYWKANPGFLYYKAYPNSPVDVWALSRTRWINGCHHIWYKPVGAQHYVFYDYAKVERVY